MFKFFRKIRQNLMLENRTGKYFKYAIGEIFLVVIGILIALQINNWNEERKILEATKIHLNNLVDAIKDDSIVYVNYLETSLFRYYSSQYLLRIADEVPYDPEADGLKVDDWKGNRIWKEHIPTEEHKEFIRLAFLWTQRIKIITKSISIIEELKRTDVYSYLKNERIKNAIDEYYTIFKFGVTNGEENQSRTVHAWANLLMDEGILNSTPYVKGNPIELLKSNPALIGRLRGLAKESSWSANNCKVMTTRGAKLCSVIEDEISKM